MAIHTYICMIMRVSVNITFIRVHDGCGTRRDGDGIHWEQMGCEDADKKRTSTDNLENMTGKYFYTFDLFYPCL